MESWRSQSICSPYEMMKSLSADLLGSEEGKFLHNFLFSVSECVLIALKMDGSSEIMGPTRAAWAVRPDAWMDMGAVQIGLKNFHPGPS